MSVSSKVPEISAWQLSSLLDAGGPLQLVDVRAPRQVEAGRIEAPPSTLFLNIVGSDLLRCQSLDGTGIDPATPTAVVCSRGHDSATVADHLHRLGCRAASLHGGMAAWMRLVVPRDLEPPPSLDRFVQLDRPGKGALGYLLVSDGEALAVDPPRDVSAYVSAARTAGAQLIGVADTHCHADYISGGPALARIFDVPYYLHPRDAVYPYDGTSGHVDFTVVEDGEVIRFGRCALGVLHTPGHTEGSVCYTVNDAAVMSGDLLFVASAGRPDLAGRTAEWTIDLWESLQKVRGRCRADVLVCPAHYSSAAERRRDGTVAERFAALFARNEALQVPDQAAFERWVANRTDAFPEAYRRIKAVNIGLLEVDEATADDLEVGRNQCALTTAGPRT